MRRGIMLIEILRCFLIQIANFKIVKRMVSVKPRSSNSWAATGNNFSSLVAKEYLDGELAKYETWESLNESIKTLSASVALSMAGGLRFVDFGCGKFSTTDFSDLNNSEHRSQRTGRKKDKMRNCYFRNLNFCLRFRV
jgi:hypothetical protein